MGLHCLLERLILGQVWYLIVSIPDLCNLTYIYKSFQQMTKADDFVVIGVLRVNCYKFLLEFVSYKTFVVWWISPYILVQEICDCPLSFNP